jgi:hypothetical protein
MAKNNFWDEFIPDSDEAPEFVDSATEYSILVAREKERKRKERLADENNEVGFIPEPTPEILEERRRYEQDYALAHAELFPMSTGIKPLGQAQLDAVKHSQYFIQNGSHILKCEPRGFGKTSRSTNEGLMGVLQGFIRYLVIVASNTEKAEEIIASVMTELFTNEQLFKLYPRPLACFRKTEKEPRKSLSQTYNGTPTYIYYNNGFIVFPYIEGEPSSGAIIDIRARKNVRGIYHTIESGEFAGRRQRPTHAILDDIQTDEEAENPKTAAKIIRLVKRSIMMAGGHDSGISIMMNGTPIAPGDVTHHFLFNEPWQHVIYKMLITRSRNEEMWFGRYQELLMDFDKETPGSRVRAAQEALQFYIDNREAMDDGAEASWHWCYKWNEKIQTEISAIQHAYNIMILEGMDVFESECQCNVTQADIDNSITYCSAEEISNSQNSRPRYVPQVKDKHIVTHIDVNQPFLTYMTVSSPDVIQPSILDYGTHPQYTSPPEKAKVGYTLTDYYKKKTGQHDLLFEDVIYLAVKDLVQTIAARRYKREDGVEFANSVILVDSRFQLDNVMRAIRDSNVPNVYAAQGQAFKAKDIPLDKRKYSEACNKYHKCVAIPTSDRMLRLTMDINYFKTQTHLLFSRENETVGSATFFKEESHKQHLPAAYHFNAELPFIDIDDKTGFQLTLWQGRSDMRDNEYFDNFVGCLAALSMKQVDFTFRVNKVAKTINIKDYFAEQKRNR